MKRKALLLLIPFAVAGLAGCQSADPGNPTDQCDQAEITLNKTEATLKVGQSVVLEATAPAGCGDLGWGVNQAGESVVSLQKDGTTCTVTATSVGTAIVGYGTTASCTITVEDGPGPVIHVESIRIADLYPKMKVGDPDKQIDVTVTPENADNPKILFESKNTAIATVSDAGLMHAIAPGDVDIVVTSEDNPEATKTVKLTVSAADVQIPSKTVGGFTRLDSGELEDGSTIEMISQAGGKIYGMKKYVSGNNIPGAELTVANEKIKETADVHAYKVVKNADGSFSFKDGDNKYLYAAGGSEKNNLKSKATLDDTCKFTVSISNGLASIVCKDSATSRGTMCFNENNGSPIFNCYTSAEKYNLISFFVKDQGEQKEIDHIAIEGTLAKTTYNEGDSYSSDGLKVIAYYKDSTQGEVVAAITPSKPTAEVGDTSITFSATYETFNASTEPIAVTVNQAQPIPVETEYTLTAGSLGLGSYADGKKNGIAWTMLMKGDSDSIQGNSSKSSKLWNIAPFSKPIEKVTLTMAKDSTGSTGSMVIGSETFNLGKETDYPFAVATPIVITPTNESAKFEFNFTSGAVYFASIKFEFAAEQKVLTKIEVQTPPSKNEYYQGDTLNTAGMVVMGTYEGDPTPVDVTSKVTVSPTVLNTIGDSIEITVTLGEQHDTFNVIVNAPRTITSVVITDFPSEIEQGTTEADLLEMVKLTINYSSGDPLTDQKPSSITCDTSGLGPTTLSAKFNNVDATESKPVTIIPKVYVSGCKAAVELAASLPVGQTSSEEVEISGRIMFMPGNNLIIQDGDYSVIVWKNGQSTQAMQVGKKASMKCKVQNYNGAAETVQLANTAVTISDENVPTANKATVSSKAEFEAIPFSSYCKFENVILLSKPALASGSDATITVAFKDDLNRGYQFFVKKSLYAKSYADVLNGMEIGAEFTLDEAYVGVYKKDSAIYKQLCSGLSSVVTDTTHYDPESVSITKEGEAVTTLNLGAGDSVQLDASVLPAKAPQDVVWSVEPAGVVTVEDGLVTVVAESDSQAVVKATANGTEIYGSVTVNVALVHEITSIEISGQMKTEYTLKDTDYDVSGLTVTAIYNSDPTDTEDVTDEVEWSFDPVFPAVVTDSLDVEVTATLEEAGVDDSIIETISISKEKEYMNVEIPITGFSEGSSYVVSDKNKEVMGVTYGSYNFNPSNGQIRGSNTSISDTSVTANAGNWHFYNKTALSSSVKTITVSSAGTIDGNNYFKNNLYLVYGDESVADVTSLPENKIAGVMADDKASFTFDVADISFKYFKICSNEKFTNGTITKVSVTLEIEKPAGGIKVDSVELNKKTLTLAPEATETLEATVGPSYADNKELEWSSDDTDIAVVDQTGKVTAVADGKATITATAKDGSGVSDSCVVTVQSGAVVINPITLSTDGGTSASAATVKIPNGDDTTTDITGAIKCGTGSVFGAMNIVIPKDATKLVFYAAAWKGENVTLSITGLTETKTIALTSDSGIANNSPFTLSTSDMGNFYKEIDLGEALAEATTITLTATGGKRFVVWSAGYVK